MSDEGEEKQDVDEDILPSEIRRHFEESYEKNREAMERLAEL